MLLASSVLVVGVKVPTQVRLSPLVIVESVPFAAVMSAAMGTAAAFTLPATSDFQQSCNPSWIAPSLATEGGLMDQMLGVTVGAERPDLEKKREELSRERCHVVRQEPGQACCSKNSEPGMRTGEATGGLTIVWLATLS